MKTTLRRVKEGAYSIVQPPSPPHFFAFFDLDAIGAGTGLLACTYSAAGEWLLDRGEEPSITPYQPPFGGNPDIYRCIVGDPGGRVADGSLALLVAIDTIAVWDVQSSTIHLYTAPAGHLLTPPLYLAGSLYWWETLTSWSLGTTLEYTLRKAFTDLSSPTTVGTISSFGIEPSAGAQELMSQFHLSTVACRAKLRGEPGSGASFGVRIVRMELNGSNPQTSIDNSPTSGVPSVALPDAAGTALGSAGTLAIRKVPVDASLSSSAQWPSTGDWAIDDEHKTFGVSADRARALQYGVRDLPGEDNVPWAVEALTSATSGEPIKSQRIHPHPDLDPNIPKMLFLMV